MNSIPWPFVPLLTGAGCGLAALLISVDKNLPISRWEAIVGGSAVGVLIGIGVWIFNRRSSPGLILDSDAPVADRMRTTTNLPIALIASGIGLLLLNYLTALALSKVSFALIVGGTFITAIGISGLFVPIVKTEQKLRWWQHLIQAAFCVGGLTLGVYFALSW